MTESGCARRLRGLCLRPRRPGRRADERRVLAGWPGGGTGEGVRAGNPGCLLGRAASVSGHLLTCPASRKSPTPHGALRGCAPGTDPHRWVWRTPEGVWAREDARGHVSLGVSSVAGLGAHLRLSTQGTAGAQLGRTRCGHLCLWLSDLCARGPLHTHRRRGDVGACGWMWGEACAQPSGRQALHKLGLSLSQKNQVCPLVRRGHWGSSRPKAAGSPSWKFKRRTPAPSSAGWGSHRKMPPKMGDRCDPEERLGSQSRAGTQCWKVSVALDLF